MTTPSPAALFLSRTVGLYLGPLPVVAPHRSCVASFVFHARLERPMRVRTPGGGEIAAPVVYVPPGGQHAPVERDAPTAALYLELGSEACARARARFGEHGRADVTGWSPGPRWSDATRAFLDAPTLEQGTRTVETLLSCLAEAPAEPLAPRLEEQLARLWRRVGALDDAPAGERAIPSGVSASRARHLFVAGLGVGPRRTQLWLRLRRAIVRVAQGANLTDAAHEAGFFDSAHFSRAFRSAFGITPSSVFLRWEGLALATTPDAGDAPAPWRGR